MKTMALNYGSLDEVHGAPFGTRIPLTQGGPPASTDAPLESTHGRAAAQRTSTTIASLASSLPLDTNPATESFTVRPDAAAAPMPKRMAVRESFADRAAISHSDAAAEEKLTRILRLIEQNRTGYERPAIQDMVLYIVTGIFFLFTFDTFVSLGASMRPSSRRSRSQRT